MYHLNLTWKVGIDEIIYLKDPKQSEFVRENIVCLALDGSFPSVLLA